MTRHDFHGVSIAVSTDRDELTDVIASRLREFDESHGQTADLQFEFVHVRGSAEHVVGPPEAPGRAVYNPPEGFVSYFESLDQLYADYGDRVRVMCEPARGRAVVSVRESRSRDTWLASHPFFTLPLVEMLKRRGLFSVHAAGVAVDGRAVVVAGGTGAGKSTLTLALLRAGFEFLGDDMSFLRHEPEGLRVLAFPDEIDVTAETIELFPSIEDHLAPAREGWSKRQVRRGSTPFNSVIARDSSPAIIVFPHVSNDNTSRISPLGRADALLELVPNVLLTEPLSSQAHLDALGELVRQSECYRLETGRDLHAVPDLVRELLEHA